MSDGPHKSLNMRSHWRRFAERADKAAYSLHEVSEALSAALQQEFREAPLRQLKKALGVDDQGALFSMQSPQELDALRDECPGSAAGNALIDCAKEAVGSGLGGETACERALANALDECLRSAFRGIEEHYYRKAPGYRAQFVRSRLDEERSRCDANSLAKDMLNAPPKGSHGRTLSKYEGLDEGPELR